MLLVLAALLLLPLEAGAPAAQAPPPAAGIPGGAPELDGPEALVRLENEGFVIGWSPRRRLALWVAYQARAVVEPRFPPRPDFAPDPRLPDPVSPDAFRGSGYDRGHLAPNYLISNRYGRDAQRASFLMSNVAPQSARLNQLAWQRLEEIEVDRMAPRLRGLWVIVGPVFDPPRARLPAGVDLPDAFYRLWLDETAEGPRVMAFIVPQQVRGDERLDAFIVTVDTVEARTGLDFYARLADPVEARLEAAPAEPQAWGFAGLACFPARYAEDWQGRGGVRLDFSRCGG